MAITYNITESVTRNGSTFSKSQEITAGDTEWVGEYIVPNSTTDQQVVVGIDVSAVKACVINSTKALTIETNGTTGDESLVLVADIPYVWYTNKYDSFKFSTDVTALYLTNASGSSATVNLFVQYDATP